MPIHHGLVSIPSWDQRKIAGRIIAATALLLGASLCMAQQPAQGGPKVVAGSVTVQPGTRIMMTLLRPISTKATRAGDNIYLQTTFPVTAGNQLLIPAGTFLQGKLAKFVSHKDRLELQMQSATLIFSNGYSVNLPAVSDLTPGPDADIRSQPGHPKAALAGTTASSAGGLAVGGLAGGTQGAVLGGAIGGAAGFVIAEILLHHGNSTQIEAGSPVEITLQHPLLLDKSRVAEAARKPSRIILAAGSAPKAEKTAFETGTCFTPDIPATPDTIIPGTPGIPATPNSPGIPGTPPVFIPGTPAIHGMPYPCPR